MKQDQKVARNITIAYVNAFLSNLAFFLPVMTLFFQQVVNSVTLVALIFSIQAVTSVIFEIPTGAFADLFGRRKTLIIQGFLAVIAITLLAVSTNFLMLAIFSFIFALKNALGSGTDQAIIYDSLKQIGKEKEYKKIQGYLGTLTYAGAIIGSIAGGFMAGYFIRLPFLLTIPLALVSLVTSFLLIEPEYERESHKNLVRHAHTSFKALLSNTNLVLLVLFSLFSFGIAESAYHLEQIFYNFVNLPIVYFGIVAAAASLLGVAGSLLSHHLSRILGDKTTLILSKLLDGLMILLAAIFLGYLSIFLLVLVSLFRSIGNPVTSDLLNREIESKNRATILSMSNLLNNIGYIIFAPLLGYVADIYSIATSFRISGIILMLTTGFLFFIRKD